MKNMLAKSDFSQSSCKRCSKIRVKFKRHVDSEIVVLLIDIHDEFPRILARLCQKYPDNWERSKGYHFYIDMKDVYYSVVDTSLLKDLDTLVVTDVDNLQDLPQLNLAAIHASLKVNVQLKPHQIEGVERMIELESTYKGGILADEMGLGKTIQTIALILRQQPRIITHACTLIVVPSRGVADQWAEEIRTKTVYGSLPYFVFEDSSAALIKYPCFRVAITTYDRVRAEYKRDIGRETIKELLQHNNESLENKSVSLFDIEWHRIVLDESHKVRNKSLLFDSVMSLRSRFKWCLTGTPFQNNAKELFAIFQFLEIDIDQKKKRDEQYLRDLLKQHMVRRKKEALASDLRLIPQEDKRIILEFSEPERALYDYLEKLLYLQLAKSKNSNSMAQQRSMTTFISYLRLKQVCSHYKIVLDKFPDLIPLVGTDSNEDIVLSEFERRNQHFSEKRYFEETTEYEEALDVIASYYDQLDEAQEGNSVNMSELCKLRFTKKSTKVAWLIHFLRELLKKNPDDKVIVVSQFVEVILKINESLTEARIPFQTYHGDMKVYARKRALELFNTDSRSKVMVMSLKCGGVGLNLQRANHMIIMDRWWNPATMDQLTSRVHRMTQYKKTYVYTIVIKDTIEETLMDTILSKKVNEFKRIVESSSEEDSSSDNESLFE